METERLVILGAAVAVLVAAFLVGVFVRRALRRKLRAALGDSYRKERTYAGVIGAIALDEQGLRFAWAGTDEGTLIISVDEVVEVVCEKSEKPILATIFKILTNRDDIKEDLQLISLFRQDELKDIAARLNAMRNRARAIGTAAPIPPAATETETLVVAIQQLTAAVTTLTGSMRRFPPADARRRSV